MSQLGFRSYRGRYTMHTPLSHLCTAVLVPPRILNCHMQMMVLGVATVSCTFYQWDAKQMDLPVSESGHTTINPV